MCFTLIQESDWNEGAIYVLVAVLSEQVADPVALGEPVRENA